MEVESEKEKALFDGDNRILHAHSVYINYRKI